MRVISLSLAAVLALLRFPSSDMAANVCRRGWSIIDKLWVSASLFGAQKKKSAGYFKLALSLAVR
jgi:hypothetical protein